MKRKNELHKIHFGEVTVEHLENSTRNTDNGHDLLRIGLDWIELDWIPPSQQKDRLDSQNIVIAKFICTVFLHYVHKVMVMIR